MSIQQEPIHTKTEIVIMILGAIAFLVLIFLVIQQGAMAPH